MKRFAALIDHLAQAHRPTEKVGLLREYFESVPENDRVWAIALLTHHRTGRLITTTLLRDWAAEKAGIPSWLFEESYQHVGDLAETLALVLPLPERKNPAGLSQWIRRIDDIRDQDEEHKRAFVFEAWESLDPNGRYVFNKMITGGFRPRLTPKILTRALSAATGIEGKILAHRLSGTRDPFTLSYRELVLEERHNDADSQPYPFCAIDKMEKGPDDPGDPESWRAEKQWEGMRAQLIVRKGELFLWSCTEELITGKFPELGPLKNTLPDGTVIEGMILPWKNDVPLPFHLMQTRLTRSNPGKKTLENTPVIFMAGDLLEHRGKDLRKTGLDRRRRMLEELINDPSAEKLPLKLSPRVEFATWDELRKIKEDTAQPGCTGVLLKRKDSHYPAQQAKGEWHEWKIDPLKVIAVLTYVGRGGGQNAGLYADYTFSLRKEDELVTITRISGGLSEEESREVDQFVKQNTLERFGPVRSVKAELIFEISFEGIAPSKRHKCGLVLRFPKISRWLKNKTLLDAHSIEELQVRLAEERGLGV